MTTTDTNPISTIPAWFKPHNVAIKDHATQRFLERINPYASYAEARQVIRDSLIESTIDGSLVFQKTQNQPGWAVTVTSKQHDLTFVAIFPYCQESGALEREADGKLPLVTIMDAPPGLRKQPSFKGNHQQALHELAQKSEALTQAKLKLAAAKSEVNDYKMKHQGAQVQIDKMVDYIAELHSEKRARKAGVKLPFGFRLTRER